jgi:cyclic-di-GMP-binding biofilm dispersal mediator protein
MNRTFKVLLDLLTVKLLGSYATKPIYFFGLYGFLLMVLGGACAVGVVAFGDVATLSTDVMEDLFMTNTFIPIMVATEAMNTLSTGGVIVNISGVIAEQNLPGMVAYGASKAALRAFDEGLAREARRKGVRVIDARPPHTETGLAGRAIAGTAPKMGEGLEPAVVARVICDGIESGATDLGSEAFVV